MNKNSRHHLAEVIGERTLGVSEPTQLAREIAAYLLSENLTYELESLVRDVMEYRMKKGVIEAKLVSAHALGREVEADVRKILHDEYPNAKQIRIDQELEPETVGGVRIELPNEQLDLTVRSKLNTFKRLTEA